MIKKISVLLFLMLCNFAFAANWVGYEELGLQVDTDSIKIYTQNGDKMITLYTKLFYNIPGKPLYNNKNVRYVVYNYEANCSQQKLNAIEVIEYNKYGRLINHVKGYLPMSFLPGSATEGLYRIGCAFREAILNNGG